MGEADGKTPEPFRGFKVASWSFKIEATKLKVCRTWLRDDVEDGGAKFDLEIGGKAQSEDSVVIIGESESTTDFHFYLTAGDPVKSWLDTKETELLVDIDFDVDSTPERRLKKRIYRELDQVPPTATLFWYDADWGIECKIPEEVHNQLAQDIIAGVAKEIRIQIEWVAGLARATTWGLFRVEPDAPPEPLRGHVESLTWILAPPSAEEPTPGDQQD